MNEQLRAYKAGPMKKMIVATMLALLAGCATVDGVGRDISGAARGVQSWF